MYAGMLLAAQQGGRGGGGNKGGSSGNSVPTSGAPKGVTGGQGTNIASRNGRGVTTGVPPTGKGRSAGNGRCRNQCCPNCNNGTPRYWTLKIPAATPGLYLATFQMEHSPQSFFEFGCSWLWTGSTLQFGCAYPITRVYLFIYSHGPMQVTMTGPDGVIGYYVLNGIPPSISCTSTRTLTWSGGSLGCSPLFGTDAELVPSTEQYEPCCGECAQRGSSGSGLQSCSNGCCSLMDSTEEYDVDLGAGGWTNDRCSFCTSVTGVFTVSRLSDCSWEYSDADVCTCTNDASRTPDFKVRLYRTRIGTSCYWVANVWLFSCGEGSSEGAGGEYATYYGVAETTGTACNVASAKTLTKTAQSNTASASECNGSLPNTITIQSV